MVNTNVEVMFDSGAKQRCPLSSTLFGLYIDEVETYLDEIDMEFPCSFNIMVIILPMLTMCYAL